MDRDAINKKLRNYYEFTNEDLYANSMNKLSSAQENRLRKRSEVQRKGGLIITTFFLGLGLCLGSLGMFILVIALIEQDWNYSTSTGPLIYTFAPSFFLSAIGAYTLWNTYHAGGPEGKLFHATGPITLRVEQQTTGGEYPQKYKIYFMKFPDGSELSLDDDLLPCVLEGEEYAVNYYMFDDRSGGLVFTMEKL